MVKCEKREKLKMEFIIQREAELKDLEIPQTGQAVKNKKTCLREMLRLWPREF
jgi:hypothetical protein